MREPKTCVFGAAEGSLPQVMVPEGGSEAETPAYNLIMIFLLLANLILEISHQWKQTITQPI